MARNVPDLALLLSVQSGFDTRLPLTRRQDDPRRFNAPLECDLKGQRIGWLGDLGGHLPMDKGMLEICEQSLAHFKTIGCSVESVVPNFDFEQLFQAWLTLRSFTFAGEKAPFYDVADKRALLKPEAIWEIERGLRLTGPEIFKAAKIRSAWYMELNRLFKQYDFLVMPTTQVFPFIAETHWPKEIAGKAMDTYHRWMEAVVPVSMAGLPTLAVPAGFNSEGLPVGIQIIGPQQNEFAVLQMGHAYDLASQYSLVRSPLLNH
jgi:amidase